MDECVFKLRFSVGADVAVGVVFGRQEEEVEGFAVFELRQGVFKRAPGGFPACGIAVEAKIDFVGLPHQDFDVFARGGSAE